MSLTSKMMKPFEVAFLEYTQFIAGEYGIDQEVLLRHWNDRTKMKIRTKDTPKVRSAYHVFSAEVRKELEAEEKKYSFGEVSVIIGARWKALSAEEKAKYVPTIATVTAPSVKPVSKEPTKTELLEKATALGLKIPKSKSKAEIMEKIRKAEKSDAEESDDDASIQSAPKELSKTELLEKATALGLKIPKSKSKAEIMEEIRKAEEGEDDEEEEEEPEEADNETADNTPSGSAATSPVNVETMVENSGSEEEDEDEEYDPIAVYQGMKPQDLAEMCTQHGLSSKGNKDTLIRRLMVNKIK
jgi:hypothetical protein